VETLRGDKDRFDALITVLNVGFERGGVVTRLEKRGERFVEEPYEVYAPRVLAGITGLKDTLEDRSLPLFMLRKRRNEPVARLNRATDAEAQALRDRCAPACLARIGDILGAYDLAPGALERDAIDDRAVDLWTPLLAIAFVADMEDGGNRSREILDAARDAGSQREADAEAGTTAQLLEALEVVRLEVGETPAPAELRGSPGPAGLGLAEEHPPPREPSEPARDRPATVLERGPAPLVLCAGRRAACRPPGTVRGGGRGCRGRCRDRPRHRFRACGNWCDPVMR
jgi:hypothetical protein